MPTNEVLHEMVRSIKEELLPDMRAEMRDSFNEMKQSTKDSFEEIKLRINKHDTDIVDMRSYIDTQKGYIKVLVTILSYLAGTSIISWIQFLRK